MEKKYLFIPVALIALLSLSSLAFASAENDVGVEVDSMRSFFTTSSNFEAGEYSLRREFGFRTGNWPDRSGESIKELKMVFDPKNPGLLKDIENWDGEVVSRKPYILVGRDIEPDSGMGMHIMTDTEEKEFVPVSIKRDVDFSYFETTGTQLVTVTVVPEKEIEELNLAIRVQEARQDYQDLVEVKLLSTSKDYFSDIHEGDEINVNFRVPGAEEGKEYVFKAELEITPLKGQVTHIPAVWVSIGSGRVEGGAVVNTTFERSTKMGTYGVTSSEEVNFHPNYQDIVSILMEAVSTTTRFLEDRPVTTSPPTTPGVTEAPAKTAVSTPAPTQALAVQPDAKPAVELDSDGDGWADDLERRAGTNPYAKDTDGDGLWDSKDPNPLEAPKVQEGQKEDLNWEQIGVILAIIGAAIGGLLGRRKRGRVKKLLDDIDKTYEGFKMNSRRCEAELYKHRDVVSDYLKRGKINEESYSILDKRIDDYLSEIREKIMVEKVGNVPSELKGEVHNMLKDGEISENEFKAFENLVGKSRGIGDKEKSDLKDLFKKWRDEDKITGSVLDSYIDDYMKDLEKAEGKISGLELKDEIDKIMEDGVVTLEEYEEFSHMLDRSELSDGEKESLKKKLRKIRDLSRGSE